MMTNRLRSVTVHQIPQAVTASAERRFLSDLQKHVAAERPRIVLDCSEVEQMSDATVHLLLRCLEEAMKSNGDVKLAALSQVAESGLRKAQVSRLFEVYPTPAAAIHSYQSLFRSDAFPAFAAGDRALDSESAA